MLLPSAIIKNTSFYLDDFAFYIKEEDKKILVYTQLFSFNVTESGAYLAPYVKGHYISANPILIPILSIPFYALYSLLWGLPQPSYDGINILVSVGSVAGSVLSALAVCIMLIFLRKLNEKTADYIIVAYAMGTLIVSVGGTLNNHIAGLLFLPLAWFYALKANEKNDGDAIGLAGFFGALAFAGRYTNIVSYIVLFLYCIFTKKNIKKFLLYSAPVFAIPILYNYFIFGSPFDSAYSYMYKQESGGYIKISEQFSFNPSFLNNIAAILISPNRGFFFFSPFLIFSIFGVYKAFRENSATAITMRFMTLAFFATIFAFSFYIFWTGGARYGYIFFLDIVVYPMLLISYASEEIFSNKIFLSLFALSVIISIPIAIMGITYGCNWAYYPTNIDETKERVWDFNDLQITRCLKEAKIYHILLSSDNDN
jgi:hypothetical protein